MAIVSWTLEEVKSGFIRRWYDLRANIPTGWHECDGTNGTPDLRDTYAKGAAAGQEANVTGGALTHTHAQHAPGVTGTFAATSKLGTSTTNTATIGHSHTTPALSHDTPNNEPPYKTTIWIMKL